MNRQFSEVETGNKYMKKHSASLDMKEMQIKSTLSFHLSPVRLALIKRQQMLVKIWGKGTLIHCWWKCKLVQPLWKSVWRFLRKLKTDLSYDPAIALLGIYPKRCKSMQKRDTCTPMFIAVLLTIAKLLTQPRCPTRMNG
jgi:hypothetical protein